MHKIIVYQVYNRRLRIRLRYLHKCRFKKIGHRSFKPYSGWSQNICALIFSHIDSLEFRNLSDNTTHVYMYIEPFRCKNLTRQFWTRFYVVWGNIVLIVLVTRILHCFFLGTWFGRLTIIFLWHLSVLTSEVSSLWPRCPNESNGKNNYRKVVKRKRLCVSLRTTSLHV